jgi:hypothetical protein
VDDNSGSIYKNCDHAGTPENFASSSDVTGGAGVAGGVNGLLVRCLGRWPRMSVK